MGSSGLALVILNLTQRLQSIVKTSDCSHSIPEERLPSIYVTGGPASSQAGFDVMAIRKISPPARKQPWLSSPQPSHCTQQGTSHLARGL
jgi:hypothetical protein